MSENKDRVYAPAMNWSAPETRHPTSSKPRSASRSSKKTARKATSSNAEGQRQEGGWINFEMKEAKTDATTSSSIHGSRSHRLKKTLRSDSPLTPSDGLGRGATAPLSFGE